MSPHCCDKKKNRLASRERGETAVAQCNPQNLSQKICRHQKNLYKNCSGSCCRAVVRTTNDRSLTNKHFFSHLKDCLFDHFGSPFVVFRLPSIFFEKLLVLHLSLLLVCQQIIQQGPTKFRMSSTGLHCIRSAHTLQGPSIFRGFSATDLEDTLVVTEIQSPFSNSPNEE